MVFSSIPVYLDPPNWPQQPPGGIAPENSQQLPPRPPPLGSGGVMGSSIRPGSMADRARQAKIPQPEVTLKCPRCESTNTKFCYFNNYSFSQPRHFCKTCRRYWTRGGALRNVPVGGGCRRNKRSKSISRLKSPGGLNKSVLSNSTCTTDNNDNNIFTGQYILQFPPPCQLPILPPLHHLGEFNSSPDIGLSFAGIQAPVTSIGGGGGMEFPLSSNSSSGGVVEQWRLQQFPSFLNNNLDSSSTTTNGFYGTDHVEGVNAISEVIATMKTEERNNHDHQHHQGLSLSRDLLGVSSGNIDHYWGGGGNTWTDLPGFTNTSSSAHLM